MLFTNIVPLAILSLAQSYVATAAVVIQPVSNTTLSAGQNVTYTWTGEAPFNVTIRNRYPMYDGQTGKPANYLGRSDEYPLVNTSVTSYTHFVPQNGQYSYGSNWTVYVVIDDSSEGDGSYAESAPLQVSGASAIPTSAPGSGASALTSSTVVQSLALAAVGVLGLSVL